MEEKGEYCWMWTKRKHSLSSIILTSPTPTPIFKYESSWEEQAFAEDGRVGGCIWPPSSYSCSFCNREFKSAQALGGHMNVHRRDRARLKQPPTSPHNNIDESETNLFDHQLMNLPFTSSLGSLYFSNSITTTTSNPNSSDLDALAASKAKLAPAISSNFGEDERFYSQKLDLRADHHKRRRITTDASSTPLLFTRDHHHHHHHHIKSQMSDFISPSSINEELDLELRLGHNTPN